MEIRNRLDALEHVVDYLPQTRREGREYESAVAPGRQLGQRGAQPVTRLNYVPNAPAEQAFESDVGAPLDEQSYAQIADVFHAFDSVNASDISCKSSVCRVTYSKANPSGAHSVASDEVDFSLVEKLSESLGVDDLDVRYARDEQGSEVMYIQLH